MANRYSTIDELTEATSLIKDVLVTIKGALRAQQDEIMLISQRIAALKEEVDELNREKASRDRKDIG